MTFDFSTIEEQFKKLPEEVQYTLTSPHITEKIQEIAEKNGLLLDQMDALYDITSYVMLGLLPSNRYTTTLAKELNVSEKQAKLITDEINNGVFLEIRKSMREFEEKSRSTNSIISNFTQNQYNRPPNNPTPITPPSSPHADLEQAGDFKIENEINTENNFSLKSPQKKPGFVIEPKAEQPAPKVADMAMFTPAQANTPEEIQLEETKEVEPPKVDSSSIVSKTSNIGTEQPIREYSVQPTPKPVYEQKSEPVPTFDPKSFYNFSNIEVDSEITKRAEDEIKQSIEKENKTNENQVFQKSASEIHFEKEARNKHSKISASQAYQPKVREFVKKDTSDKDNEVEKIKNDIEKENTALIDELMAHPKVVVTEVAKVNQDIPEQNTFVTEKITNIAENKKTADAPVNLPIEQATPVVNLIKPNTDKTETIVETKDTKQFPTQDTKTDTVPTIEEKTVANKFVSAFNTNNAINQPVIATKDIPKENTTSINTTTPTNEDIRRDIRSKVSEFNPTTKWASPIPNTPTANIESLTKENLKISEDNDKVRENIPMNDFVLPKEIKSSVVPAEIKPKTIVPPPINRPKGFDPYREAIQ